MMQGTYSLDGLPRSVALPRPWSLQAGWVGWRRGYQGPEDGNKLGMTEKEGSPLQPGLMAFVVL